MKIVFADLSMPMNVKIDSLKWIPFTFILIFIHIHCTA